MPTMENVESSISYDSNHIRIFKNPIEIKFLAQVTAIEFQTKQERLDCKIPSYFMQLINMP